MNFFRNLAVSLSMYSIIPMPQVNWEKSHLKYVLCFFPLVGILIGGAAYGWLLLAQLLHLNSILYAAIATVLPVIISGGIHTDGFIDSCDALFSYGDREKKLAILKDSHIGAFGVLFVLVYFIVQLGLYAQFYEMPLFIVALSVGFFISRCISGLSILLIKSAKESGLAYLFADAAAKKKAVVILSILLLSGFSALIVVQYYLAATIILLLLLTQLWFVHLCRKQFGGITGDLAGFLLSINELLILAVCTMGALL